jgi:hypothetical protein
MGRFRKAPSDATSNSQRNGSINEPPSDSSKSSRVDTAPAPKRSRVTVEDAVDDELQCETPEEELGKRLKATLNQN